MSLKIVRSQVRLWDRRGFFVWGFHGFGAFLKPALIFQFKALGL